MWRSLNSNTKDWLPSSGKCLQQPSNCCRQWQDLQKPSEKLHCWGLAVENLSKIEVSNFPFNLRLPLTGTPPLTRFFGPEENRVKGKPHYRRSILVLKPKNGEYGSSKSTFSLIFFSTFLANCTTGYLILKCQK